jgi:hypothetical protein
MKTLMKLHASSSLFALAVTVGLMTLSGSGNAAPCAGIYTGKHSSCLEAYSSSTCPRDSAQYYNVYVGTATGECLQCSYQLGYEDKCLLVKSRMLPCTPRTANECKN